MKPGVISMGTRATFVFLALVLLLPAILMPVAVVAADDPLEGLNDDEKAYVGKVRQAYANARSATAALKGN